MTTPLTIGNEFVVNTTWPGSQSNPDIAVLSDGRFVFVWEDNSASGGDTSDKAVRGQIYAADGSRSGAEFLVNTTTSQGQGNPSVAPLTNGGFVVVWEDGSASGGDTSNKAVRGQMYTSAGVASGGEFLVNTTTTNDQSAPVVGGLANGGFVILWEDSSASGGDTSSKAVRGQMYTSAGATSGGEFLVNTTTTNDQSVPAVATLTGGGFVVVWQDSSQSGGDTSSLAVRGQMYTSAGATSGGEFLVNATTNGIQGTPAIAALTDGGFVVTWADSSATGGDTSSLAIRGQKFTSAGAPSGGEFLVNTTTAGNQILPSVAGLSDGGFIVTWTDDSQIGGDTSLEAVRGQMYAANGAPSGSEFLVNTTTFNPQSNSRIGALPDGGFAVAWTDGSSTGDDPNNTAIRAQLFHATTLSIAATDASKAEGGAGGTPFTFTVTRAGDTTGTSSVNYAVAGSGADAASADDFQGGNFPNGTVTFTAGETAKTITVTVAGDTAVEADEGFTVTLSNAANGGITTAIANGTIQNDDTAPPADNGGGGGGDPQDPTVTVRPSGLVDALLAMVSTMVADPAERAPLTGPISAYVPAAAATSIAARPVTVAPAFGAEPGAPIVISGGGKGEEALVVDARRLSAGSMLRLDDVAFAVLLGSATVHTGNSPQYLVGDGGRQNVTLGAANDTLYAGEGDDVVAAAGGADLLYGNTGTDLLFGNAGADTLFGGQGSDTVYGGRDDDLLYGDRDDDQLFGGEGDDREFGGDGADLLFGNQGSDTLYGNVGADTLYGGLGDDTLFGGRDDDLLFGDAGNDLLFGDLGNDTLSGGSGADVFAFGEHRIAGRGDGNDVITDFNAAEGDRIQLRNGLTYSLRANAVGEAVIVWSDNDSVTLRGIGVRDVQSGWFIPIG